MLVNNAATNSYGEPTGAIGQWFAHDGDTISVGLNAGGPSVSGDMNWGITISVEVYTPSITLSGGGTISENGETSTTITASRDGDASTWIESLDVYLTAEEVDGVTKPTSDDFKTAIPDKITIPAGYGSGSVTLTAKDDAVAEGKPERLTSPDGTKYDGPKRNEAIRLSVNTDDAGSPSANQQVIVTVVDDSGWWGDKNWTRTKSLQTRPSAVLSTKETSRVFYTAASMGDPVTQRTIKSSYMNDGSHSGSKTTAAAGAKRLQ